MEAVRALYRGTRDVASEDEALAAFGLKRDESPDDAVCWVWPENWDAVQVFASMVTQWNVGFAGPVGLRYEVVPLMLRVQGVERSRWPDVFAQVRLCEGEALRFFAERRSDR